MLYLKNAMFKMKLHMRLVNIYIHDKTYNIKA